MAIAPRSEDAIDSKEFRFLPRDAVNFAETEHDQAMFSHGEVLARFEVHNAEQSTAKEQHKHNEDRNGDEDKQRGERAMMRQRREEGQNISITQAVCYLPLNTLKAARRNTSGLRGTTKPDPSIN